MIEGPTRFLSRYQAKEMLKDRYQPRSADDMFDAIFGAYDEREQYKIVDTHWRPDTKWYHRLNRLWAYPLTLLCWPFRYVMYGESGWSDEGKIGSFILKACGYR